MVNKIYSSLILLVAVLSLVSASDTTVIINTAPNFTVNAFFTETTEGVYSVIEMINEVSDSNGKAMFILSTDKNEFELKINLRKDGETHYSYKYNQSFQTGGVIELDLYPRWYPKPNATLLSTNETAELNETVEITNETINETADTNIQEESNVTVDAKKSISGNAVLSSKTFAYAGGILVIVVILLIFIRWRVRLSNKQPKEIKVVKLSEMNQNKSDEIKSQETQIEEAKRALREAEERLQKIKNPDMAKIEEAKRKLIEDEKELIRLRREYSGR